MFQWLIAYQGLRLTFFLMGDIHKMQPLGTPPPPKPQKNQLLTQGNQLLLIPTAYPIWDTSARPLHHPLRVDVDIDHFLLSVLTFQATHGFVNKLMVILVQIILPGCSDTFNNKMYQFC